MITTFQKGDLIEVPAGVNLFKMDCEAPTPSGRSSKRPVVGIYLYHDHQKKLAAVMLPDGEWKVPLKSVRWPKKEQNVDKLN